MSGRLSGRPPAGRGVLRFWPLLLLLLAWLPGLQDAALVDPDEGRNASIAREMADRGDFFLPRLNGLPFLDKPFLSFALQAAAIRVLGPTERAARLPSTLALLGLVALAAWFARREFGADAAWVTALAAGTAPLAIAFARIATFDSLLTLWTTLAMLAFYRGIESDGRAARRWARLAWIAMALGVVTKGPVALLLPLLVGGAYAAVRHTPGRGRLRVVFDPLGVLLFLGLLAPWLGLMEVRAPGFLRYALVEETWARATTDRFRRSDHLLYFVPVLAVGAFPWSFVALGSLRAAWSGARDRARPDRFLWLWILLPFLVFSLSQSKRPQYALPLLPAVALLCGHLATRADSGGRARHLAALAWVLLGAALLVFRGALVEATAHGEHYAPGEVEAFAWRFGAVCIAAGLAAGWPATPPAARRVQLLALALPLALFPLLGHDLIGATAEDRSARRLAASIEPRLRGSTLLVGVDTFAPSLPFYLGRPVVLSAPDTESLTSNSILHFEADLARSHPDILKPADWWRGVIAKPWRGAILLVRSNHATELGILDAAGLERFFVDDRVVAFAYTPRARRADPTPATP